MHSLANKCENAFCCVRSFSFTWEGYLSITKTMTRRLAAGDRLLFVSINRRRGKVTWHEKSQFAVTVSAVRVVGSSDQQSSWLYISLHTSEKCVSVPSIRPCTHVLSARRLLSSSLSPDRCC